MQKPRITACRNVYQRTKNPFGLKPKCASTFRVHFETCCLRPTSGKFGNETKMHLETISNDEMWWTCGSKQKCKIDRLSSPAGQPTPTSHTFIRDCQILNLHHLLLLHQPHRPRFDTYLSSPRIPRTSQPGTRLLPNPPSRRNLNLQSLLHSSQPPSNTSSRRLVAVYLL